MKTIGPSRTLTSVAQPRAFRTSNERANQRSARSLADSSPCRWPRRRPTAKHHHRPPVRPGMYDPCREFYVSVDSYRGKPRQLAGHKTPRAFYDVWVATAHLSRDGRPCYAGNRGMCRETGHASATVTKYQRLLVTLGIFGVEHDPGVGSGRLTSRYIPLRSPYWNVFSSRQADIKFDAQLSELQTDSVKSIPAVVTKPAAPAANDSTRQASPSSPIDPKPKEKALIVEHAGWQAAVFIAIVLRVLGFSIKTNEASNMIRTARRRGLTSFDPEAVALAIRDDATTRNGFDQYRPQCLNSPPAFLHAEIQSIENERVKAVSLWPTGKSPKIPTPHSPPSSSRGFPTKSSVPVPAKCELCGGEGWCPRERADGVSYVVACSCEAGHVRKAKPAAVPAEAHRNARLERPTPDDLDALIPPEAPAEDAGELADGAPARRPRVDSL